MFQRGARHRANSVCWDPFKVVRQLAGTAVCNYCKKGIQSLRKLFFPSWLAQSVVQALCRPLTQSWSSDPTHIRHAPPFSQSSPCMNGHQEVVTKWYRSALNNSQRGLSNLSARASLAKRRKKCDFAAFVAGRHLPLNCVSSRFF